MKVTSCFQHSNGVLAQLIKLYGPDAGLRHYRSSSFAVHPDCQGKGIGTVMNKYIYEKVSTGTSFQLAKTLRDLQP